MREEGRAGLGVTGKLQAELALKKALCKKWVCDICGTGQTFVPPSFQSLWCRGRSCSLA